MRKAKLSINEQIKHLRKKGITFNNYSEKEAKEFLEYHSYFFKIKSYCKCFRKYTNPKHANFNQYISLDFNQLVVFSKIDMLFRQCLLSITLDIEHSLKVILNKTISEDDFEDGYEITKEFLAQNTKVKSKITDIKNHKKSNAYVYDLVNKYENDFASWNLVEILTFGDLIFFHDFYTSKKQTKNDFDFLLRSIKFARNAAAHNNCMLNQLNPNGFKNTPSKKLQNIIKANLPQITSTVINKNTSIPVLHDFAACIFGFKLIVKSKNAYERATKELKNMLFVIHENSHLFSKELNILSGFDFIKKIIDIFCQ